MIIGWLKLILYVSIEAHTNDNVNSTATNIILITSKKHINLLTRPTYCASVLKTLKEKLILLEWWRMFVCFLHGAPCEKWIKCQRKSKNCTVIQKLFLNERCKHIFQKMNRYNLQFFACKFCTITGKWNVFSNIVSPFSNPISLMIKWAYSD